MTKLEQQEWQPNFLTVALAELRLRLERQAFPSDSGLTPPDLALSQARDAMLAAQSLLPETSPFRVLAASFELSPFERSLLLLCAGVELDGRFPGLCAAIQGETRPYATFSLALSSLEDPRWEAFAPSSALRFWRLIEVGPGATMTTSPLRIEERILHYLLGDDGLDERLLAVRATPAQGETSFTEEEREVAGQLSHALSHGEMPLLHLYGGSHDRKRAVAEAAVAATGLVCEVIAASALPTSVTELNTVMRLWEREFLLGPRALVVDAEDSGDAERAADNALTYFVGNLRGPLIVSTDQRRVLRESGVLYFELKRPSSRAQGRLWKQYLGGLYLPLRRQVDRLTGQFCLPTSTIEAACASVTDERENVGAKEAEEVGTQLWDFCRLQSRARLDGLAQRIETTAGERDLILPEEQRQMLRELTMQVRHRTQIYDRWGFSEKTSRGLGIAALFAGPSGTGKTLAAEVLANELRLDLYRIDLSAVVSKYIGETEKNLRKVFDAAEEGGAILLFDEADAIFGKRSEVKDSHDRHANIEVSYLLQRIEAYRGLAILTTNVKNALDPAFLRRLRFVVDFPFPDASERAEIWRRVFPPAAPLGPIEVTKLARLNFTGANIRNVALQAAFLAADGAGTITMQHLLAAARSESTKLGKNLSEAETRDWVT